MVLTSGLAFCPADVWFGFLPPPGQLYGLEKFWAFLKYSKAKNLDINSKLQEYLSKFKRLEDFRVDVSRHNACTTLMAPANKHPLAPSKEDFGGLSPSGARQGKSVTPGVMPYHCSQARKKLQGLNIANALQGGSLGNWMSPSSLMS